MNGRRSLLATLAVMAYALLLSACFGSSSGPPLPIAVSFSAPPPTSVNLLGSFQVTAIVSNGPGNAMVNWSCMPTGACGSFAPTETATGVATSYTAPMTAPAGNSVTISAVSANDMTKAATANVTIGQPAVTFNPPAPPPSLATSAVAQVSATVTSMVANEVSDGLDWTATCSGATSGCGMFSAAHTNSGAPTTYTAPPTVPAGGLAVTVKAASTLNPGDSVSGVIFVSSTTTSAFLCANCSYTYTVSGEDANGPFSVAGVFTADGMGNITGGEQDFSDLGFTTNGTADPIQAGSTYQFTSDGRGTITLVTNDPNIGANGTEVLGVAFVSANHLLITELDNSATASGTMDMQTIHSFTASTLSGGYTFVFAGAAFISTIQGTQLVSAALGGVFNVNSAGTISGAGSVADLNVSGSTSTRQGLTGSYTVSDQLGRIQLTLRTPAFGNAGVFGPAVLDGYVTDATHVKFVEVDQNFGITGGLAVGQGAKTGMLGSASQLPANSTYVFTAFGSGVTGPLTLATTFTSDGVSKLQNGSSDVNAAGVPSSGSVSGTYSVDSGGTGRVGITLNGNVGNPGNTGMYAIYLTGGADPPMGLELDGNAVTTGNAYTQAAGPFTLSSFKGSYGLNFTLFDPTGSIEVDVSGQVFADGAGNLLGTMDINDGGTPKANQAFTGAYASSATGRFTGSVSSTATGTLGVSYFVISPTQVVFIETDANNAVSLGLFQLQTPPF